MELEPNTRLFLVVGKSAEAEMLTDAFKPFGTIQSVKMVKEKGVAYIKYDKASSAAAAIETMHETVLNDGRGPMVKVMFAEAPKASTGKKNGSSRNNSGDLKAPPDPDNVPPLSRLFIVVPKTADGAAIEAEMSAFQDLQYCKTDLIASKGIVFCKYSRSSSALRALESVQETGMLAGYKVKCMLAEPKGKRSRNEALGYTDPVSPVYQAAPLAFDMGAFGTASFPGSSLSSGSFLSTPAYPQSPSHSALSNGSEARAPSLNSAWAPPYAASLSRRAAAELNAARLSPGANALSAGLQAGGLAGSSDLGALAGFDGLSHLAGLRTIAAMQGAANLAQTGPYNGLDLLNVNPAVSAQVGLGGFSSLGSVNEAPGVAGLQALPQQPQQDVAAVAAAAAVAAVGAPAAATDPAAALSIAGPPPPEPAAGLTQLYVVAHKSVSEEELFTLFQLFPGMEACDLKCDHATGLSRGFAYVTYDSPAAATVAVGHLNGLEFPPASGHRIKVMFAEQQLSARRALQLAVQTNSAIGDSNDTLLQQHLEDDEEAPESRQRLNSQDSVSESLDHKVEVAAVQNSLSHLSMPQRPEENRGPVPVGSEGGQTLPPLRANRNSALYSSESDKECEAESQAKTNNSTDAAANTPEAQARTVYTILTRPLPTYALQHYFARCGAVEHVRLQPRNERHGIIRFKQAESARTALEQLNGTDICGEALNVLPADPLQAARNKRARVAA